MHHFSLLFLDLCVSRTYIIEPPLSLDAFALFGYTNFILLPITHFCAAKTLQVSPIPYLCQAPGTGRPLSAQLIRHHAQLHHLDHQVKAASRASSLCTSTYAHYISLQTCELFHFVSLNDIDIIYQSETELDDQVHLSPYTLDNFHDPMARHRD